MDEENKEAEIRYILALGRQRGVLWWFAVVSILCAGQVAWFWGVDSTSWLERAVVVLLAGAGVVGIVKAVSVGRLQRRLIAESVRGRHESALASESSEAVVAAVTAAWDREDSGR